MPARSTMLTGQYVRTHGVVANGVPLPEDAPSVAAYLPSRPATAPRCSARPTSSPASTPKGQWEENRAPERGDTGPWRGFEHSDPGDAHRRVPRPADRALRPLARASTIPSTSRASRRCSAPNGGGDTGAPETKNNPIPREWYHTDWVADRTIDWLDSLAADDDWFCWMSFPDPHHPWDPPASELRRVPWRTSTCRRVIPGSPDDDPRGPRAEARALARLVRGSVRERRGRSDDLPPGTLTHDQIREINAKTHVMNELIDEACGRVLRHDRRARLARRHRRHLHHRSRRAAGRLRLHLTRARSTPTR